MFLISTNSLSLDKTHSLKMILFLDFYIILLLDENLFFFLFKNKENITKIGKKRRRRRREITSFVNHLNKSKKIYIKVFEKCVQKDE